MVTRCGRASARLPVRGNRKRGERRGRRQRDRRRTEREDDRDRRRGRRRSGSHRRGTRGRLQQQHERRRGHVDFFDDRFHDDHQRHPELQHHHVEPDDVESHDLRLDNDLGWSDG